MTLAIISTNLNIASIFTKTKTKHSLLNKPSIVHYIIYWVKQTIRITTHPKNTISLLCVEEMSFFFNTPKCKHKAILTLMIIFTKVDLISHHIAIIITSFRVPCIKFTSVLVCTATLTCFAI